MLHETGDSFGIKRSSFYDIMSRKCLIKMRKKNWAYGKTYWEYCRCAFARRIFISFFKWNFHLFTHFWHKWDFHGRISATLSVFFSWKLVLANARYVDSRRFRFDQSFDTSFLWRLISQRSNLENLFLTLFLSERNFFLETHAWVKINVFPCLRQKEWMRRGKFSSYENYLYCQSAKQQHLAN